MTIEIYAMLFKGHFNMVNSENICKLKYFKTYWFMAEKQISGDLSTFSKTRRQQLS